MEISNPNIETLKAMAETEYLINQIIKKLANGEKLEEKNKDYDLHGNWEGYRECRILPDWLLVYKYIEDELILYLTRTGTHSDLF